MSSDKMAGSLRKLLHCSPEKVIDFGGCMIILEKHGEYIELRAEDESIIVRFKNFDGIAIVDGAKESERREMARRWDEQMKEPQSVF